MVPRGGGRVVKVEVPFDVQEQASLGARYVFVCIPLQPRNGAMEPSQEPKSHSRLGTTLGLGLPPPFSSRPRSRNLAVTGLSCSICFLAVACLPSWQSGNDAHYWCRELRIATRAWKRLFGFCSGWVDGVGAGGMGGADGQDRVREGKGATLGRRCCCPSSRADYRGTSLIRKRPPP